METEAVTYSKYKKLNSNILKIIAITAMTLDHLAWALWSGFSANPIEKYSALYFTNKRCYLFSAENISYEKNAYCGVFVF